MESWSFETQPVCLEDEKLAMEARGGSTEARNALFMKYRPLISRLAGPAKRICQPLHGAVELIRPSSLKISSSKHS